jgi:2-dehydro-3-deoxygluconokinase
VTGHTDKALRIACIGECMIEISRDAGGALRQGFGGDTANLAAYLARLLPAAQLHYVTALGDDVFSEQMLAGWREEGIETGLVRRLAGRLPGLYWIQTDAKGERSFHYWRDQSAARELLSEAYATQLASALAGFDLVCFSGITLAILPVAHRRALLDLLGSLRAGGSRVVFDTNFRARLWSAPGKAREWEKSAIAVSDIVIASFDDERELFGEESAAQSGERLSAAGVAEVVVRQGAGACLLWADGSQSAVAPEPVARVLDTTGAGDAFDAAYLAARCSGAPAPQAALCGHRLAARVVAYPGAMLAARATPGLAQLLA